MSGEAYAKRYPAGFADLPAQTSAIDAQFLNAVEQALVRLLKQDPVDGRVMTWDGPADGFKTQLVKNLQIDPAAAISRSKLDFGGGLVDADIAPGANIASSKISGLGGAGGAPPTGGIMPYAGSAAPSGWLLCDGSAVSRTLQSSLFSVIGITYGGGDGSSTFNVPDLRGRVIVGVGTHADVASLGLNEGAGVPSRRPKHGHVQALTFSGSFNGTPGNTGGESGHTHGGPYGSAGFLAPDSGGAYRYDDSTGRATQIATQTTGSSGHYHGFTPSGTISGSIGGSIGAAGLTDSEAYMVLNFLIKT